MRGSFREDRRRFDSADNLYICIDENGKTVVLREETKGFTCMPGNPGVAGDPPMCADAASMQWAADSSLLTYRNCCGIGTGRSIAETKLGPGYPAHDGLSRGSFGGDVGKYLWYCGAPSGGTPCFSCPKISTPTVLFPDA